MGIKERVERMSYILREYKQGIYAQYTPLEMYRQGLEDAYEDICKKGEFINGEDLEKAAKRYATEGDEISGLYIIDEEIDAFKAGANWQKEQMLAKAANIEVKVDAGGNPYIPQIELYDYVEDIPLAKEGDKYKVILIKEE